MYRGKISDPSQIKKDWSPYDEVDYNGIRTTVGRVLFNSCLPKNYPFVNETVDKKKLNQILSDIFKNYTAREYVDTVNKLMRLGFRWYTLIPKSIGLDDLEPPPEIIKLKKQLDKAKTPEEFDEIFKNLLKELQKFLDKYGYDVYDIVASGGRGNWRQIAQVLVAKGIVVDPNGNVLPPIKKSFSDGLSPTDFFYQGVGARSGVVDRALSTAPTGYLTRRLIYATQSVLLSKDTFNCKTKRFVQIKVTPEIARRIIGRYLSDGTLVTEDVANKLIGKLIELKSPIYCKSPEICYTCYGKLADVAKTRKIGILAAETIGERGTQLVMKQFHLGGTVTFKVPDIFEVVSKYNPKFTKKIAEELFTQKDNKVIANKNLKLTIDKSNYATLSSLVFDKESMKLHLEIIVGKLIDLESGDEYDLIVDNPAEMYIDDIQGDVFTKECTKGQELFELKASTDRFAQAVEVAQQILEGRIPWKTPEQLLLMLFDVYKDQAPNVHLVHFEVVLSNLLRNRKDPTVPARLVEPYDPVLYGLKKVPYVDGSTWLLGFAFENAGKAIEAGLVLDRHVKELSPLEKLLLGEVGE